MKFNWLPWKYIIRFVARRQGFLDPISVLSQLSKFSQPSEVAEPIELLRAGVVFHARGLINSRVIQHNLDWVWPYWVERQFDPTNISFVPRAFSITHVNLTHRNWTAVGIPDFPQLPIVDPCGLVTPHLDKWSLDAWIIADDGRELLPSRADDLQQNLEYEDGVCVVTSYSNKELKLTSRVDASRHNNSTTCNFNISAIADTSAWLVISLRPYNPEGISFINDIEISEAHNSLLIDKKYNVLFDQKFDKHRASTFKQGDVYRHLFDEKDDSKKHCDIGLITSAALFRLEQGVPRNVVAQIPLTDDNSVSFKKKHINGSSQLWDQSLHNICKLSVPDKKIQYLYETSVRTLILCSPREIFPGPYTYKRFWYRDAAFITCGLLYAGLVNRAEISLSYFPKHQKHSGYFHSQEGEWDSNGEVLWILKKFYDCTNRTPGNINWWPIIKKGGKWIQKKRLKSTLDASHAGLLPAGFSAEHLGPNDYYYWDDFWSVSGLNAAVFFAEHFDDLKYKEIFENESKSLLDSIESSLNKVEKRIKMRALPASPYRRMDSGAIGSLAAGYPLQLYSADDERLKNTVDFLLQKCFVGNGFFQDMIHSGVNPYLTLHVAQVLMRAGDARYFDLLQHVADLASPTGQWPEAIHPHTLGGCMGDGQHAWAAAEWVIMLRNCFAREEDNNLILASGISRQWLDSQQELSFGPALTSFGNICVRIQQQRNKITVAWDAAWWRKPDKIEVKVPGLATVHCHADESSALVTIGDDR